MIAEYLWLAPDAGPPPRDVEPLCVVLLGEARAGAIWRNEILEWLQRAGCLYFIAWGEDCETWHDAMDHVHLEAFNYDVPDDKFMMTTWHARETMKEALWFARFAMEHPTVPIARTLLLHVAAHADEARVLHMWDTLPE